MTSDTADPFDARERLGRALALGKRMLRLSWLVLLVALIGELVGGVFLHVRKPRYMSEVVILYSEGVRALGDTSSADSPMRGAAVRFRETLLARPRLTTIIKKYGLYPEIVAEQGYVDAVDQFRKDIVFRAPGSDTFAIAYRGTSPEQARNVTAALANSLMNDDSAWRKNQAVTTRDFLRQERKRSEEALKDAEASLAKFMADHPEFALDVVLLSPGAPATGAAVRAAEAGKKAPASGEQRYRWVRREAPLRAAKAIPLTPEQRARVAELRAESSRAEAALAAAQANLRDKLSRFTEQHPDVIAAKAQVAQAHARLEQVRLEEASVAVSHHTSRPKAASKRTEVVRVATGTPATKSKGPEAKEIVDQETEWTRLTRAVTEARERHDKVDASYFRADVAARSELEGHAGQMLVLDPAYQPRRPVPPGPVMILAIFLGGSFTIGLAIAGVLAAVDDRLYDYRDASDTRSAVWPRSPSQIDREEAEELAYPVFAPPPAGELGPGEGSGALGGADAIVPAVARPIGEWKASIEVRHVELADELDARAILLREPESVRARSYRALRHQLRVSRDPRIIAVTSAATGEGKTTCALNLALAASEEMRMRVLLVEANVRTPSLAKILRFTPPLCFAEQMERVQVPSSPWVVAELNGSRLHVAAVDAELVSEHRLDRILFASALGDFRAEYDYIVIDTPAVLESADVLSVADSTDGLLVMARAKQTTRRQIRRLAEQLDQSPVLGLALLSDGTVEAACL